MPQEKIRKIQNVLKKNTRFNYSSVSETKKPPSQQDQGAKPEIVMFTDVTIQDPSNDGNRYLRCEIESIHSEPKDSSLTIDQQLILVQKMIEAYSCGRSTD